MALVNLISGLIWIFIATLLVRRIKRIINTPETRRTLKGMIDIILSILAMFISLCVAASIIMFFKIWATEKYLQGL